MLQKPVFEIRPQDNIFRLRLNDIWQYRDLLFLFVRRDIVATYKQTILGPLWLFIQPILTSVVMLVVFSNIAGLSTDGMPALLFYLSGNIAWAYFATCLRSTSNTFVSNAGIFGKVYFPRLISPLSTVVSNLVKFSIQFCLFLLVFMYYYSIGAIPFFNIQIWLLPALILLMGFTGLGFGIIISSLTTKYRDLTYLVEFGVQLMMYFTPVILPLSVFYEKMGDYAFLIKLNPMTGIVESFREIFLGSGDIPWSLLCYSTGMMVFLVLAGILLFNKTEKNFMDTV